MGEIRSERDGAVAVVSLAAPERRNALVPEMAGELVAACEEIDADPGIGAAVIRADGASFCSGAHRDLLATCAADPADAGNYAALDQIYQAFTRVGQLRVPVIAAVRGHAVGAGVNLVLAADLRIMADTAQIATGFADIGVHPGGGHFTLMNRLAGREATAALSLFGERVSGADAARIGLAWAALPGDEVEPRCLELAHRVARRPALARAMTRSFRLSAGPPALSWQAALETERGIQLWSLRNSLDFGRLDVPAA
jgi:enoyl-CoA hydratase